MSGEGTAELYDRWAATYDLDVNRTRDLAGVVLRAGRVRPRGRDVVEAGCGTGRNTAWLAEGARSLVGLDFSARMLARARARGIAGNVRYVRHDLRTGWPLRDRCADLVVITLVLEHVAALGPVFLEAGRVLRAGGELVVCELHPYRQLAGKQARFTLPDGERIRVPAHLHDIADFLNAARDGGLELHWAEEPRDDDAPDAPPRLFCAGWRRGGS